MLRSSNISCLRVTAPSVTEAEQPAISFSASREILDFGQQLSVCVDGISGE